MSNVIDLYKYSHFTIMDHENQETDHFRRNFGATNFESSNMLNVNDPSDDLEDCFEYQYSSGCQTWQLDYGMNGTRRPENVEKPENNVIGDINTDCINAPDHLNNVNEVSGKKLKDSTEKLLGLLEGIKNTYPKNTIPRDEYQTIGTNLKKLIPTKSTTDNEKDDCSVYKRLTRKCHCLNRIEYNDFIIHFNESTKYFTSTLGEIIKNMRILKKFLYMGGDYTKHALTFLDEGLAYSTHTEKVETMQGIAYADVCNVFDDQSIVIVCIAWPCGSESYGEDPHTQALTASFLNKLVQLEEGRRYLKFTSKITSDLRKIIRKHSTKLEFTTLELLNSTLNILNPLVAQNTNVTYYCKPVDKGFGSKTMSALLQYRRYMTLEEVFTHLDLLHSLSNSDSGRNELNTFLPTLLSLFTQVLKEYDNSQMNIIVTNILNNVITRTMIKPMELPQTVVIADTATEPIEMKDEMNQIPFKRNIKKDNKSKLSLGISPFRIRQSSKRQVEKWDTQKKNKSRMVTKDPNCSVIVVPIEE